MRERIDAITNLRPATPRHAAVGSPPSWPTAGPPRKGSFLTSGGCDELHKITAGSGYDYLTQQVAVQDSTEKGHLGLASYTPSAAIRWASLSRGR